MIHLPFVHVKNKSLVLQKLESIKQDGIDHLHIISDFDMTLTKYWVNGKRNLSSHGVLESSEKYQPFKQVIKDLYDKYYPMEVSPTLSKKEKVQAMVEWWSKAHEYVLKMGMTKADLVKTVQQNQIVFRQGSHTLIQLSKECHIPLLVFSAGIADIIQECLLENQLFHQEIHIISNRMIFEDDVCKGFEEPLIHVFNKNEACLEAYKVKLGTRKNLILLGDSLGDIHMSDGMTPHTQLTIGWLNHDQQDLIAQYEQVFDIVVLDDSPMDFVCDFIQSMRK